jgi:transcriptional regulator with XRE-family HTH domain
MENFQSYLVTLRQNRAYSQSHLAKLLCVSLPYLNQIEHGKKPLPSKQFIARLKLVMELTPKESLLLDESIMMTKQKVLLQLEVNAPSDKLHTMWHLASCIQKLNPNQVKAIRAILNLSI